MSRQDVLAVFHREAKSEHLAMLRMDVADAAERESLDRLVALEQLQRHMGVRR